MIDAGLTSSDLISTSLISNTFCTKQVTIINPAIPTISHDITSSSNTVSTLGVFTISETCDDISFTYAATLSSGASLPTNIGFNPATRIFTISGS